MTYAEVLEREKRWHKRALIVDFFHKKMLLRRSGKWDLRATAKALRISLGSASESVRLATAIIDNPELQKMKRHEALEVISK